MMTFYYEFDSIRLTPEAQEILKSKKQNGCVANPTATVIVEGHCDNRGTNEYNLALWGKAGLRTCQNISGRSGNGPVQD